MLWYGPALVGTGAARFSARLGAVLAGALVAAALPNAGGAGSAPALADDLRARSASLADRSSQALLELYSLETRLAGARATLERLRANRKALAAERELLGRERAVTQRALELSEARLAQVVRSLYEQGETEPLAILLGAASLDEALTGLDSLSRAAELNERVVADTRAARTRLARLARTLSVRERELTAVVAAAEAETGRLEAARAERAATIASLRRQRDLTAARIASLEAQARAAERKSEELARPAAATPVASVVSAPAAAPVDDREPTATPVPAEDGERTLTVSSTGYSLPGTTATGLPVGWGVVAVDPAVIPLGTRMTVPGYGEGVAADTGSAVRGATIDLWFPTTAQALAWGRRTVTVTLY